MVERLVIKTRVVLAVTKSYYRRFYWSLPFGVRFVKPFWWRSRGPAEDSNIDHTPFRAILITALSTVHHTIQHHSKLHPLHMSRTYLTLHALPTHGALHHSSFASYHTEVTNRFTHPTPPLASHRWWRNSISGGWVETLREFRPSALRTRLPSPPSGVESGVYDSL